MRHLKSILIIILLIPLSCCLFPAKPLQIAINPWVGYETLSIAQLSDSVSSSVAKIIKTKSLSDSAALIKTGQCDAAALTVDEVLSLRAQGVALTVVLVFDISAGADLLLTKPSIQNLGELSGKTIGLENSALGQLMLAEVLKRSKLNEADVDLVYRPVAEHYDLWQEDRIDALITYLPISTEMEQQGTILFDSRSIPNTIFDVLAIRTDILDKKRENLKSLLEGYFKTLQQIRVDNPNVIYQLSTQLNMSVKDVDETLRGLILPGLPYNRRLLSGATPLLAEQTDKLMATMIKSGIIDKKGQKTNFVDATFLPGE
jgi:NitT/TauT family transport system substrate-binding protein